MSTAKDGSYTLDYIHLGWVKKCKVCCVGLHAKCGYDAKPSGRLRVVGDEQADWEGGQEEGFLVHLEGEEKERERRVYLRGKERGGREGRREERKKREQHMHTVRG